MASDEQSAGKITAEDIGWLIGVIEGEGSFMINSHKRRFRWDFEPKLGIVNTIPELIEEVARILKGLEIGRHVQDLTEQRRKAKPYKRVAVEGVKRLSRFFEVIPPSRFRAKRAQAEIMHQYLKSRLAGRPNSPILEDQLALIKALREHETKGKEPNAKNLPTAKDLRQYNREGYAADPREKAKPGKIPTD